MGMNETSDSLSIRETIFIRIKAGGFRQGEVSKAIGVRQGALSSYLYGHDPLPYEALEKLCITIGLGFKVEDTFICEEGMLRNVFSDTLKKSGMKTNAFARAAGINYTSISSYINGNRTFSNKNLEKSFSYLNLHLTIND